MYYNEATLRAVHTPSGVLFRDSYGRFTNSPVRAMMPKEALDAEAAVAAGLAVTALVIAVTPLIIGAAAYAADGVSSAYTYVADTVAGWF